MKMASHRCKLQQIREESDDDCDSRKELCCYGAHHGVFQRVLIAVGVAQVVHLLRGVA